MEDEKRLVPRIRFPEFTDDWEQRKLSEVTDEFQSGKFIAAADIEEIGKYPVYGGNGLRGYCNSYNHDGDFALIGRQGALCGNMNYSSGKAYFTEHAVAVKANESSNTRFLYYLLDKMNLGQYSDQSAQPGLAVGKLVKLENMFPSKEEQDKIGGFFENLDNLITLHQRECNTYKKMKKGIMQKLFNQEVRFKKDDGSDYADWEETPIGNMLDTYTDKNNSALHPVVAVGRYGIRRREDIFDKELSKDISKNRVIDKNTMIIGMGSKQIDLGFLLTDEKYSVSPAYATYHIQNVVPKFFEMLMNHNNNVLSVNYMIVGARQGKSVDKDGLLAHTLYIPTETEEQTKIANCLAEFDNLIDASERRLEAYKLLKKAMLQKMFV